MAMRPVVEAQTCIKTALPPAGTMRLRYRSAKGELSFLGEFL